MNKILGQGTKQKSKRLKMKTIYAPQILAPEEGLPSRTRKGSLRSLAMERTPEIALLYCSGVHTRNIIYKQSQANNIHKAWDYSKIMLSFYICPD